MADEPEPEFPGKAAVLAEIAAERARLDAAVARLSAAQLEAPVLAGGRAPKDVLAHLLGWEGYMVRNVRRLVRGEDAPYPLIDDSADEDDSNERLLAYYHPWPVADVLAESRRSYDAVWALLNDLSEAEWQTQRPGRAALWGHIVSNTTWHYQEHRAQLDALLGT